MSKGVGKQFPPGYPPTGTDLCLLSMDGGGVRGISSLLILRKLMEAINPKDPPRPCDYFDMIGGTSTGGLIALMLGRMCLTVDECIEAYNELSPKVFAQVRHRIKLRNGETQGRFDHTALENGVRQLLEVYGMDAESLLKDPEESCSCKVFVCATSQQTGRPVILSNYYNERRGNEWLNKVKIWQAVRATSAATTFFDPMTIDDETFVDGATGANNPVNYLWSEAGDVWGNGDELDPVNVKCLVSIGTGVPALTSFGSDIPGIAKALKAISTDTEETANLFQQHHSKLFKNGNAFRFNVSKGLEAVGLQEVEKWSQIKGATLSYIQQEQTFVNLRKCALMLQQRGWTRRLAEAIVRVANPSIEALNHDENHISHVDLQWLTHTVAYEKWITRSAVSSTLWYQQQQDSPYTNRKTVAASVAQFLPDMYRPFTTRSSVGPRVSRALYYQCLPVNSFDRMATHTTKPMAITAKAAIASFICQTFILDSSEPSTLESRIRRLRLSEREHLNLALSDPEALDISVMSKLLETAVEICGQPACIAVDNFHLLGETQCANLIQMLRVRFDKPFQHIHENVPLILSGVPTHRVSIDLTQAQQVDDYTEYNECLQSLHFPEWNTRREQIEKADEGTNLWIWENQQYEGWDRADRGLLWIEGKPGSGKSVLARSMQQRIFASAVQTEAGFSIVAAWFYSTRLGDVGTSDISLLRSIIYEILSQEPVLFETTVEYYRRYPVTIDSEQNGSHARSWCSSEDFAKAGQQILEQISATGKSVICIIDAMDEADSVLAFNRPGHKSLATPRVTTLLKTLSSLATDIKDSRIKFVVLSRPEPLLELDFIRIQRGSSSVFRITLEHENAGDIGILVDRGLKVLTELMHSYDSEDEFGPSPNRGIKGGQRGLRNILHTIQASEEETLQRIRQYMLENARGVMLWVSLALKDLQETAARGMVTFAELESRLKSFPLGLDQFYDRIIHDLRSTLSQEELLKSRSILMLISGSGALGRPLTLQELWEALAVPADLTRALASSSDPIINNRVIIRSWRDFRRQLKRYCGHLIELVSTKGVPDLCDSSEVGPDDTVQFIHRTLKDFLGAREKTDNFSISEHDARVEVKELVSRYVEIAFRHTGALYRPKFKATKESSWKRNVESFVKYMDQRILFAFAVAILSAESASNVRIHLGIDGTVLDNLVWPPIQEWNDEMISQAFMAESRFHPGTWTTTYSAGRIRAGLLGHAVYNACYEGLVTAMKNLNILYGIISPKYTFSNKYVLNNSALRVAIKYRLLDETLELTSHDRHRAFIPTRFVHIDRDPFIELARLCGDNEIFDVVQSTTANAYVGYGGVVRWDDIMNQYDDVYNIHGDYLYKINKRAKEDENALEKQIRIERDEAEQPGNIVDVRDSIQDVICHVIPSGNENGNSIGAKWESVSNHTPHNSDVFWQWESRLRTRSRERYYSQGREYRHPF
ncbi:hypothetical protein F5X98DRAFT_352301 [Xylaria grammica]|nr:hypothetical protein F5X98DRAFT_352301 [Xylaria grammica]